MSSPVSYQGEPSTRDGRHPRAIPDEAELRTVCHDLRHHVATMLALSRATLDVPDLPEAAGELVRALVREAVLLGQLSRDMVQERRRNRVIRLDLLVERVADEHRLDFEGAVHRHLDPATVRGDEVEIRRIVENLLVNAYQAAGPAGTVTLEVEAAQGWARVVVADDGVGVEPPLKELGLGLLIVDSLARKHGGYAVIDADPRSAGARVIVSLPEARPQYRSVTATSAIGA